MSIGVPEFGARSDSGRGFSRLCIHPSSGDYWNPDGRTGGETATIHFFDSKYNFLLLLKEGTAARMKML